MNQNNQDFGNLLNAVGVILGILNLIQNDQQTAYNDVHKANDEQAERLLLEINTRFEEQNAMLKEQTDLLRALVDPVKNQVRLTNKNT